ncbi:hypothetical protein QZL74_22625 [Burkholderia gladioli pv. alliicola]|uniref:hypothetical protein n=1 Tax=Burkholderia gladioli TaxID=28095 RepID=UPI003D81B361
MTVVLAESAGAAGAFAEAGALPEIGPVTTLPSALEAEAVVEAIRSSCTPSPERAAASRNGSARRFTAGSQAARSHRPWSLRWAISGWSCSVPPACTAAGPAPSPER